MLVNPEEGGLPGHLLKAATCLRVGAPAFVGNISPIEILNDHNGEFGGISRDLGIKLEVGAGSNCRGVAREVSGGSDLGGGVDRDGAIINDSAFFTRD